MNPPVPPSPFARVNRGGSSPVAARPAPALLPEVPAVKPIDLQLLANLPSLDWRARYLISGLLQGHHRSPTQGSNVEFAAYRPYQIGDDLRRIDWRLYGRTDRLQVKQFEEEVQIRAHLVLDTSRSLRYSSSPELLTKLDYARTLLAAVGKLLQNQNDAVGLALIGEELTSFTKARSAKGHFARLLGLLDSPPREQSTGLAKGLHSLAQLLPRKSLVIIASDFYEEESDLVSSIRRLRHDHHEVIGWHVLDPMELDFSFSHAGSFIDLESGQKLVLNSDAVRAGYLKRFQAFCQRTEEIFRDHGGDYLRLRTDENPVRALSSYLAWRSAR